MDSNNSANVNFRPLIFFHAIKPFRAHVVNPIKSLESFKAEISDLEVYPIFRNNFQHDVEQFTHIL